MILLAGFTFKELSLVLPGKHCIFRAFKLTVHPTWSENCWASCFPSSYFFLSITMTGKNQKFSVIAHSYFQHDAMKKHRILSAGVGGCGVEGMKFSSWNKFNLLQIMASILKQPASGLSQCSTWCSTGWRSENLPSQNLGQYTAVQGVRKDWPSSQIFLSVTVMDSVQNFPSSPIFFFFFCHEKEEIVGS